MSEPPLSNNSDQRDWQQYHPALIRLQQTSPHPTGRRVLWALLTLVAFLVAWACWGRLDIIAVAQGRLVPASRLKIIQPAEAGIVRDILVKEGDKVRSGQVLMRMDSLVSETDLQALTQEQVRVQLRLQLIRAELEDTPFSPSPGIPDALASSALARYQADQQALSSSLAEEQARLGKAIEDLAAAQQQKTALQAVLPYYRKQSQSLQKLASQGLSAQLKADDKRRKRIEKEQELATQGHIIAAARASIELSQKKITGIRAQHTLRLRQEQDEKAQRLDQLMSEIRKQRHRQSLLSLQAPEDGVIKELATHTPGTVVQPGTVLGSLIPKDSALQAEIWISNEDIGFIYPGQEVKLKLAAYPFQKYGMLNGHLNYISADAQNTREARNAGLPAPMQDALRYRALVSIADTALEQDGHTYPLSAGMRVNGEVHLGSRTVAEYLLSPISKAWHEAGRER